MRKLRCPLYPLSPEEIIVRMYNRTSFFLLPVFTHYFSVWGIIGILMNKNTLKLLRNTALILLVTILASAVLFGKDSKEVFQELGSMDLPHILLAFACTMLWELSSGLSLTVFSRVFKKDYRVSEGFLNALVASLFNNITPSSSGGQVAQFMIFRKQGLKSDESAAVLWLEFLVFQIVLCIGSIFFYLLRADLFLREFSAYNIFFFIGLLLHIGLIAGIFLLLRSKRFYDFIFGKGILIGAKLHLIKDPDKTREKLNRTVNSFQKLLHDLKDYKSSFFKAGLCVLPRLFFHYGISFAVLTGLGIPFTLENLVTCLSLSSFLNVASALVPLPGGSGGAEAFFVLLFGKVYDPLKVRAGMLLWRFFSFYLLILVGVIAYGYYKIKEK